MTKEESIAINIIMAQFMGAFPTHGKFWEFPYLNPTGVPSLAKRYEIQNIKYTKSWDWLMYVIEKAEKDPYVLVKVANKSCTINRGQMDSTGNIEWLCPIIMELNDKKQSTIYALLEFIKQSNENDLGV